MSLPTQLAFLGAHDPPFFFLGVIHKIFQAHVGASYPRSSWLVKLYGNLTYVRMLARGYCVKLQHQGYTARRTTDNNNISWKIAIEQTSVGLTHALPQLPEA